MRSFNQKVAAITGAGSGMGRELAIQLASSGCNLALADVDPQSLAETAKLAENSSILITEACVDVANKQQVYAWADQVQQDHKKVHMVFNNAGVGLGAAINFWGVVYGSKAFLPLLSAEKEAVIINTSSVLGIAGMPTLGAYVASKYAVRGFSEVLGEELAVNNSSVRVLSVFPGGIKTNLAQSARIADKNLEKSIRNEAKFRANAEKNLLKTSATEAAKKILNAVQKKKLRVVIGHDAKIIELIQRISPTLPHKLIVKIAKKYNK